MKTRSPARAAVAVVLVALVGAACSSGSHPKLETDPSAALESVAKAMQGTSGHISGTTSSRSSGSRPLRGSWSGDVSGEGEATSARFVSPFAGHPEGLALPTTVRWLDSRIYVQRSIVDVALATNPQVTPYGRTAADAPWIALPSNPITYAYVRPYSPEALVDALAALHAPLRTTTSGSGRVLTTITPVRLAAAAEPTTVAITIDAASRVVHVRLTSATGDIIDYAVTDYGAHVAVNAPVESQIARSTVPSIIRTTGAYATVQSGSEDGITWSLQRAPATSGTYCWLLTTSKPLSVRSPNGPGGARCLQPSDPQASTDDAFVFLITAADNNAFDAVVIDPPSGARATVLGFVGGTTKPANFSGSPWVWIGPTSPQLAYVGVSMPDGTQVNCGLGAVSTAQDLGDPTITAHVNGEPWACNQA
jgi:hypothetical protein